MPSEGQKNSAAGRIHRIGVIFYGDTKPEHVMERVLADYALVGGPSMGTLAKRAKERLRRLDEDPS